MLRELPCLLLRFIREVSCLMLMFASLKTHTKRARERFVMYSTYAKEGEKHCMTHVFPVTQRMQLVVVLGNTT